MVEYAIRDIITHTREYEEEWQEFILSQYR